MPEETFPPDTYVVTGGKVAVVQRYRKLNGAPGYDLRDGGPYTHFAPDWTVHPAVVGETVCEHPRGTHWCGLMHVSPDLLNHLPRREGTTQ